MAFRYIAGHRLMQPLYDRRLSRGRMKHAITVLAVLAVLPQGGFTDAVWSLCGAAAAVFLCLRWKKRLPLPVAISMAAMVLVYIVSALNHGLSYESLAAIGRLLVMCLLVISFYNMDIDIYETVFVSGMIVAAIGFVAFCEILQWDGAVASRRLQSVFQYSNTAGLYLGVSAFLTRQDKRWKPYSIFIETAMVLTQSVGALLVYIAGWAIYLAKNRQVRLAPAFFSFVVSLLLAGMIYAIVYVIRVPQLAILLPAALIIFRNKIQRIVQLLSDHKGIAWAGLGACAAAIIAVFAMRGLTPLATYLERLIQISDGINVMARHPLGIGPGAWQFFYQSYQSAPYNAAFMHCGYVAAGVDAGFLAIIPMAFFLAYWLRHQKWGDKCVGMIMILLHAVMDISFSFLSIALFAAMLLADTLPKPKQKPLPMPIRGTLALPIALCAVIFASSAIKNSAAWSANAGDITEASALLEKLPVHSDMEASLTQMRLYLTAGEHERLDDAFAIMPQPNAEAYSIKAQSLLERKEYMEAAECAFICAGMSPYNQDSIALVNEAILHLDAAEQPGYREMLYTLEAEHRVNALFTYITKIGENNGKG